MRILIPAHANEVPEKLRLSAAAAVAVGWGVQLWHDSPMHRGEPTFDDYGWRLCVLDAPNVGARHWYPHCNLNHAMQLLDAKEGVLMLSQHNITVQFGEVPEDYERQRGDSVITDLCESIIFAVAMMAPDSFTSVVPTDTL